MGPDHKMLEERENRIGFKDEVTEFSGGSRLFLLEREGRCGGIIFVFS